MSLSILFPYSIIILPLVSILGIFDGYKNNRLPKRQIEAEKRMQQRRRLCILCSIVEP